MSHLVRREFDLEAYERRSRIGPCFVCATLRHRPGYEMSVVYRAAHAVQRAVPTERMYLVSLGSQQGNSHVHWHVAPLPPGVPYNGQHFQALMLDRGVVS